jgi:hypothetical protein
MEKVIQSSAKMMSRSIPAENESGLLSIESVLKLQKLIFAGSPLSEILTNIAQLVEAQAKGISVPSCFLTRTAMSSIASRRPVSLGFSAHVGRKLIG